MKFFLALFTTLFAVFSTTCFSQIDWEAPFPSHRIIDNVYFVGNQALGTYLITSDDGHILINTDFEATVPALKSNVESLGFKFEDIEIIVGSHAHGDHMEGDALAKEMTGAEVVVMAEDVPDLRKLRPRGKEHPIDRIIQDGDKVTLGGSTLTAYLTPGHTKGCTSWGLEVEENGKSYHLLIICSFGANDNYRLVNNAEYPEIADDYRSTYLKARTLPVDVFLGSHGFFFDMENKYQALQNRAPGDMNPYIDREGYMAHIDEQEKNFLEMLNAQQGQE